MRIIKNIANANREGNAGGILKVEDILMTSEIKCNKCGETLWKAALSNHPPTPEYLTVMNKWGKNSKWNNETHEFHICQTCYSKMVEGFKINEINYATT